MHTISDFYANTQIMPLKMWSRHIKFHEKKKPKLLNQWIGFDFE